MATVDMLGHRTCAACNREAQRLWSPADQECATHTQSVSVCWDVAREQGVQMMAWYTEGVVYAKGLQVVSVPGWGADCASWVRSQCSRGLAVCRSIQKEQFYQGHVTGGDRTYVS